ncbi:FecCD family ABC transporter permease [Nocardiopsis metallicus]|uniref:Iron complex transport system permease protein n=1 Tax=Nocardiopsis metallicus TaxID=179819 RepID=A0A840WXZ8_9ACTN|nr:iron ABC transporter permease [Nocardiopsis metallicus]MBB5495048.1 iron complex transport system permease protein [Nocardiopsis metallicus]
MTTVTPAEERTAGGAGRSGPTPSARSGVLKGGWSRGLGLVAATAALVAAAFGSVLIGNYPVTLADVAAALSGSPESDVERIILHIRVPRTVTGLLAGIALGVAGTVMQGLTRNPLAEPGLLGINSGAALAVVLAMAGFGITATAGYLWFAFAGAAVAAVLVYALGSLGLGGATPVKLALAGAAFTALFGAVTSMITLQDSSTMDDYRYWVVGSLTRSDGTDLSVVAPFLLLGVVLAVALTRTLNALALGDDLARSLGTRLWTNRAVAALAVVLLAGGATAIAGPIGFVGLVVPHVARMITGPDYRWVMAWTVVLAPTLLLIADTLGRILLQPQQLQVGIITAIAGAPFFLYLVRNRRVIGV